MSYDKCACGKLKDSDSLRCWSCYFENFMCDGITVYHLKHRELYSSIIRDYISIPYCIKRQFHTFYERVKLAEGEPDPWFEEIKGIDSLTKFDYYLTSKGYFTVPVSAVFFNRRIFEEPETSFSKVKIKFFDHEPVEYYRDDTIVMRNGKIYKAYELIVGDIIRNTETNGLKICGIEKIK